MKLNSYPQRRGPSIAKQGSDLQDLVALLARYDTDGALGATLASTPYDLGRLCVDAAQAVLIGDAEIAAAGSGLSDRRGRARARSCSSSTGR